MFDTTALPRLDRVPIYGSLAQVKAQIESESVRPAKPGSLLCNSSFAANEGPTTAMYSSIFSHNITRPYPFRWFTPVVAIGAIIALVLFSLLNLGSSGYNLVSVYSQNPNATISGYASTNRWPSFIHSSLRPTCDSTVIPVNSQLYTNNTALGYTLTGVWQPYSTNIENLGSLVYHNNPFRNCTISKIALSLIGIGQTAIQLSVQRWSVELLAYITCEVDTYETKTMINLTSTYNYLLTDGSLFKFLGRNATSKASLYWGETLLSMYWLQVTSEMLQWNGNYSNPYYYEGYASVVANSPPIQDIQSLDFWNAKCLLVPFSAFTDNGNCDIYWSGEASISDMVHAAPWLRGIWMPADSLTKSFYSTILTDLGQIDSQPNILVDADLLQYYTKNFTNITQDHLNRILHPDSNLGIQGFTASNNIKDGLGVSPSVFSTSYLCSVPQRKPFASLAISILVADLVFLSALWRLYTLCVDAYLSRRYPQMNRCEGHEGTPLASARTRPPDSGEQSYTLIDVQAKRDSRLGL